MGQVCGKINNHECEWISIQEQERRFSNHKLVDVYLGLGSEHIRHELFDHQIAHLIKDYARTDDNWSKACKLFGQDKVPAFPEEHMSEIGDRDSVFYLTPAGSLSEFETKLSTFAHEVLGTQSVPYAFSFLVHDSPIKFLNTQHDAKWALMKRDVLQGSRKKTYEGHKNLAKIGGIAIPSLQTVAKILLLDNAMQLNDALQENDEIRKAIQSESQYEIGKWIKRPLFSRTFTRVKESDWSELGTPRQWLIGGDSLCPEIFSIPDYTRMDSFGLAVVKEF